MKVIYCETFPDEIEEDTLYISKEHGVCTHICPCGCGNEIPIPIKGNDIETDWLESWRLIESNGNVTLDPSLRNTCCKAHYFIRNNQFVFCGDHENKRKEPDQ